MQGRVDYFPGKCSNIKNDTFLPDLGRSHVNAVFINISLLLQTFWPTVRQRT